MAKTVPPDVMIDPPFLKMLAKEMKAHGFSRFEMAGFAVEIPAEIIVAEDRERRMAALRRPPEPPPKPRDVDEPSRPVLRDPNDLGMTVNGLPVTNDDLFRST